MIEKVKTALTKLIDENGKTTSLEVKKWVNSMYDVNVYQHLVNDTLNKIIGESIMPDLTRARGDNGYYEYTLLKKVATANKTTYYNFFNMPSI